MNATPVFQFGDSWGYMQPDGTYDGMVGAIMFEKVDLAGKTLYERDAVLRICAFRIILSRSKKRMLFERDAVHKICTFCNALSHSKRRTLCKRDAALQICAFY